MNAPRPASFQRRFSRGRRRGGAIGQTDSGTRTALEIDDGDRRLPRRPWRRRRAGKGSKGRACGCEALRPSPPGAARTGPRSACSEAQPGQDALAVRGIGLAHGDERHAPRDAKSGRWPKPKAPRPAANRAGRRHRWRSPGPRPNHTRRDERAQLDEWPSRPGLPPLRRRTRLRPHRNASGPAAKAALNPSIDPRDPFGHRPMRGAPWVEPVTAGALHSIRPARVAARGAIAWRQRPTRCGSRSFVTTATGASFATAEPTVGSTKASTRSNPPSFGRPL